MLTLPKGTVLKRGSFGLLVERAQLRLLVHGHSLEPYGADKAFGRTTEKAVKAFQRREGIPVTGRVDNRTWEELLDKPDPPAAGVLPASQDVVPKPDFVPLVTNAQRAAVYGKFSYRPAPTEGNAERIIIADNWIKENTTIVEIPALKKIPGIMWQGKRWSKGPKNGKVRCHKLIADQLVGLWKAWDDAGLVDRHVISWDGLGNPRFIRGSRTTLSNHAWFNAFDIKYRWNMLGKTPAAFGERGSVRELVPLAHKFGFYWGGHFFRRDGMHFEAAKILP